MKFFEASFGRPKRKDERRKDEVETAAGGKKMSIEKKELAPGGWRSFSVLVIKFGREGLLRSIIEQHRSDHPDWFHLYWSGYVKAEVEYYHPDLIALVEKHPDIVAINAKKAASEIAPKGWRTLSALIDLFGRETLLKSIIEQHRSDHPDWFHLYWSSNVKAEVEYYHPDLIALVENHPDIVAVNAKKAASEIAPKGWRTSKSLISQFGRETLLKSIIEQHRSDHPDWFHLYWSGYAKGDVEYLHPDLVSLFERHPDIVAEGVKRSASEIAPKGWKTLSILISQFGRLALLKSIIQQHRSDHPDWFHLYWSDQAKAEVEYYHPDLVALVENHPDIVARNTKKTASEIAPKGWRTLSALIALFGSPALLKSIIEQHRSDHPDWFHLYWSGKLEKDVEYCHPDLIALVENHPDIVAINAKKAASEIAPKGWRTLSALIALFGRETLLKSIIEQHRPDHPDWFHLYWSDQAKAEVEYYHPDLVALVEKHPNIIVIDTKPATSEIAPKGWKTLTALENLFAGKTALLKSIIEQHRPDHPDWFHLYWSYRAKAEVEYCHPDLIALVENHPDIVAINAKKAVSEIAPKGWKTLSALQGKFGSPALLKSIIERYRPDHPDWFHSYWSGNLKGDVEYYHPDLISLLEKEPLLLVRISAYQDLIRQKDLLRKFEAFLVELRKGDTKEAQEVQEMLEVFGSSRYLDVIHSFRAEFKDIPPDDVRGMIAIYLGDHLGGGGRGPKNWQNHELIKERLSSLTFREGLVETLKEDCYHYYLDCRRQGDVREAIVLVESYREYLAANRVDLSHPGFALVIDETIKYCKELWTKYKKPERFVDSLKSDREFPDINQRMNIKELAEKQRIIIADEMGVGKSASAIMAKEELHVPCALVIVPSNVMETWKNYLSDNPKGGYFKSGQAPRVLVIESVDQLEDAANGNYEYVLISQERLGERYNSGLLKIPYTMLIADEFHKMKSLSGTRSASVLALAEKVEKGKGNYLALLSGTPIPNKIMDVVVGLKMLYPERFKKTTNWALAMQIIKGDVIDLRKLLLPRLQMKKLRDCVEMPPLTEEVVEVEMSEMEREVYSVLFENDELSLPEKLVALRKFNLNPAAIESTPGFSGAKAEQVAKSIQAAFVSKKRGILFVNDYVRDIIRGEKTIIDTLNIPHDVKVEVIHGEVSTQERTRIQNAFQDRASNQKILLVVSGQTADVGVDYSAAEEVWFYNEPWTEYGKNQQLGRANRPGLAHPLHATTFINKGTIEEGIHHYIRAKYLAIQKVLKGIPLNEMEIELLEQDEKRDESTEEVNPELAKYYFSAWDRMMQYFGHAKEMGEERSRAFIREHGQDYANGYLELGSRSYQANANRISGTLIERMIETGPSREEIRILDLASGPQMLKRHIGEKYQTSIVSMDANAHHFGDPIPSDCVVGSWSKIPFPDESFDILNFALALHQTEYVPSRGKLERLGVLMELNRVLKLGGRAVIPMIYGIRLKNEPMFAVLLEKLGFKIVPDYSGRLASGVHYQGGLITLEKVQKLDPELTADELIEDFSKDEREGLKFKEVNDKVRDTRRIATQFTLEGTTIETRLNERDRSVLQEERDVISQAEIMKGLHGGRIESIPARMIIENGFVRIRLGDKYILFKRLTKKSGVVVVK